MLSEGATAGTLVAMTLSFECNGAQLDVPEELGRASLLEVLRTVGGVTSAKDGCAPQGQCGCCTVLVDGRARVACVTPVRRVANRSVTTLEGLERETATGWAEAFVERGATQCGFCTPGIIMRFEDHRSRSGAGAPDAAAVDRMLAAHLCRCTGWQGISEVGVEVLGGGSMPVPSLHHGDAELDPGGRRATLEGGIPQRVGVDMVIDGPGFAADTAPADALIAVAGAHGDWVVAESLTAARAAAGRIQGRRTTVEPAVALPLPEGDWAATLSTSWVEPAYLESDASWCEPGGEPASVLANGGAFGAKLSSPLPEVARRLADRHGRTVLALWTREDIVRNGPKRPPVAIGVDSDGSGIMRVVATPGISEAVAHAAPALGIEQRTVPGPSTSASLRGAGWVEALCALVAAGHQGPAGGRDGAGVRVVAPGGGWARTEVVVPDDALPEGHIRVTVGPGDPLDEVVLGSYVIGAVHMAAGMVCSESLAVDDRGEVHDLTIRSFGILPASEMPHVEVVVDPTGGEPLAVSEAVFAATAAALWAHHGFAPRWPVGTPVL